MKGIQDVVCTKKPVHAQSPVSQSSSLYEVPCRQFTVYWMPCSSTPEHSLRSKLEHTAIKQALHFLLRGLFPQTTYAPFESFPTLVFLSAMRLSRSYNPQYLLLSPSERRSHRSDWSIASPRTLRPLKPWIAALIWYLQKCLTYVKRQERL
jgi:hypothetical protein